MLLPMLILAAGCLIIGLMPDQLLNNLIAPAIGLKATFNFWNIKVLIDTFLVITLGSGIYYYGIKRGFLAIAKKAAAPPRFSLVSALERGCEGLNKLHARNLNVNLFWLFLALITMLFLIYSQ